MAMFLSILPVQRVARWWFMLWQISQQVLKEVLHLEASWFLRLEQYGLEERAEGMENPEQARADLDDEQEFGRGRDKAGGREEVGSGRLVDVVVVGGKKDQHGRPSLDADSLIKMYKRSPALRAGSHLLILVFRAEKEVAFKAEEKGLWDIASEGSIL
ncbi:hypothetical protein B0H19DRAFT_1079556 [Mycena capillaripes]|nr:hypothetical protein B0H19DRAFT_1079556 [Mycena capillaripes]